MKLLLINQALLKLKDPAKAKVLSNFFKTGIGQYGEGDKFLGITVPEQRKLAKKYFNDLKLIDVKKILNNNYHEVRLTALLILIEKYIKGDEQERSNIFNFYLANLKSINNWDLVDLTAPKIVGNYLLDKKRDILYILVKSKNLWERRIAIIATFEFIKNNQFADTLKLSEILLQDNHDLIQKAVGWMLREVGKRDLKVELEFLDKYCQKMPRTMLRYAIEKFPEVKRQKYLKGEI